MCLLMILTGCSDATQSPVSKQPEQKEELRHASLAFTGDILLEDPILAWMCDFYTSETYRFKTYFDQIQPLLNADLLIGNEEVPIAGRAYGITGIDFRFNAPEEVAPQLKELGFDVLTFANNHSYDRGKEGLDQTIEALNQAGIRITGAFRNQEDRSSLIVERNGIRFAILAYTYDTNQAIESKNAYAVNRFLNADHE